MPSCRQLFDIRKATKRRKFNYWGLPTNVLSCLFIFLALFDLSVSSNAQLITGRPPNFTEFDLSQIIIPEGGEVDLKCPVVFDGFDIEWFKNGQPLQRTGSSLSLATVSRIDTGEYQCFASNGIGGSFSPVVNVTVLCKFLLSRLVFVYFFFHF